MTLDEAILHAREVASEQKMRSGICVTNDNECDKFSNCIKCAEEHEQLAEWLEDYKRLKSIPEHTYDNCHNITCRRRCEKDGYNKAIDNFANKLKSEYERYDIDDVMYNSTECSYCDACRELEDYIDAVAKTIKGG